MKYIKILLLSFFVISSYSYAQETEADAPSNLDKFTFEYMNTAVFLFKPFFLSK